MRGELSEKGDKLASLTRDFARAEQALAMFRLKPSPELKELAVQELLLLSGTIKLFTADLQAITHRIIDEFELVPDRCKVSQG